LDGIGPPIRVDPSIVLDVRDTQLLESDAEVFTTRRIFTVTAGISLLSISSVSSIAILFTISP
jgi:hypothetical protein